MIDNIELLAFIKENLALARTIVIKNEDVAVLDNLAMLNYYGIKAPKDKAKWRYYLNLNGDYHETDDVMMVKSLDDSEMIPFTKEVLVDHPATKKAYRLGSYYFSRLAAKYPHQIDLIQGIINPIPPEESIPAKPYQILRYTKDYVHWNESQLIPALQDQIDQIVYQSFNTEYKYTDDLMLPFLIAHLRESVFKFLLQCRFEHRYSRHAHPFYIWSHLQSRGISPIYKDLLNNKQTMWLFRNIDWVLRNLGQTKTFKDLIDILLTERNIPIAKYDLLQSTEEMAEILNPEPLFYSERLNLIESRGLGQTFNKIPHVMLKEVPESIDNEVNYEKYLPTTIDESTYGLVTSYPIKVLDSELVDTTNRKTETLFNLLNNELIYLSGNGLYNINLDIEEPLSGIHQRISVKDAVVLWHHLLNQYNGATCDNIPAFYYHNVLRIKPVSLAEMMSVGTKPFLNEAWCNDVLKTLIPQIKMVSPSAFYENTKAIYDLKWTHKKMVSRYPSIGYHSHRQNAVSTVYESGFIKLTDKKTYTEFLQQYDFDFSRYQKEDYFVLMWEIWQKATGWDQFPHTTIAQIQSGMIGLMRFLSSYSIQFIHQTTLENGWFEGGLDLLTENPMLLNHDSKDSPELELNVESGRIPIHHRVVNRYLEQLETYYANGAFDKGTLEAELTEQGLVYETPRLYDVELDDNDKDNGAYSNRLVDLMNRYRPFTGTLPYDIEDLIPKGGEKFDQHTLKEMIVDVFEGIKKAGPWEAIGIRIPKNGLDNGNVADVVEDVSYDKVMQTKSVDDDTNRYLIGFSPKETGSHQIKLDVVIRHTETQAINYVRFDYNTVTKQKTWAITFDIPLAVKLNEAFVITPVITGLQLARAENITEKYHVYDEISQYLTIDNETGKPMGTFLQEGWPEDLPVLYTLTTQDGDDVSTQHTYFMKGFIPSDRYYDVNTDPDFIPTLAYGECDPNLLVLERFSVPQEKNGWVVKNVAFSDTENNAALIKKDFNSFTDFLAPTLYTDVYQDKNDEIPRDYYAYYFGVTKEGKVTLDMDVTLFNTETEKTLVLTKQVETQSIDHGFKEVFTFYNSENDQIYPTGIQSKFYTELTGSEFTVNDYDYTFYKFRHRALTDNEEMYFDTWGRFIQVDDTNRYACIKYINPKKPLESDFNLAEIFAFNLPSKLSDGKIKLFVYGEIILEQSMVKDMTVTLEDFSIQEWYPTQNYQYSCISQELIAKQSDNGWYIKDINYKERTIPTDIVLDHFEGPPSEPTWEFTSSNVTTTNELNIAQQDRDTWELYPEGYVTALGITLLYKITGDVVVPLILYLSNRLSSRVEDITIDWNYKTNVLPTQNVVVFDEDFIDSNGGEASFTLKNFHPNAFPGGHQTLYNTMGEVAYGIPKFNSFKSADMLRDHRDQGVIKYGPYTKTPDEGMGGIYWYLFDRYAWYFKYGDEVYPHQTSFRNFRTDFYRQIWTEQQIIDVPKVTIDDLDVTLLNQTDFYQGIRSTLLLMVNGNSIAEDGWRLLSIGLGAEGTDQQDAVFLTSVNEVNLFDHMYINGVQHYLPSDVPEEKKLYTPMYIGFVPAKEGKQVFDVVITVTRENNGKTEVVPLNYQVELEVKPHEGKVVYEYEASNPWWLINEHTYVLTKVEGISTSVDTMSADVVRMQSKYDKYLSADVGIWNPLSANRNALDVVVKDTFTAITPELIVGCKTQSTLFSNGSENDYRNINVYYGGLEVESDNLYPATDITLDIISFSPDIVFEEMAKNAAYTERFQYARIARGWKVDRIQLKEERDWMVHVNENYSDENAPDDTQGFFDTTSFNQTVDYNEDAPEDTLFYLPTYGGRKEGDYPINMVVSLSNKHHDSKLSQSYTYDTQRKVIDTGIGVNYTNKELYIGKKNELEGGFVNVPDADLNPNIVENTMALSVLPKRFCEVSLNPPAVTVDEVYEEGNDVVVYASAYYSGYDKNGDYIPKSKTEFRGYKGTQRFDSENVVIEVIKPDISIIPLTSTLYQGVSCTFGFMYQTNREEWSCTNKGMDVYGTDEQSAVMINEFNGFKLSGDYVHAYGTETTLPKDMPDNAEGYQYGYVTFIPAKEGKQTVDVRFEVIHADNPSLNYVTRVPIDVTVGANEGNTRYDDEYHVAFAIDEDTPYRIRTFDTASNVWEDRLIVAQTREADSEFLSVDIRDLHSVSRLWVKVNKYLDDTDRDVLVVNHVMFTDRTIGLKDKRMFKSYLGMVQVKSDVVYEQDKITPEMVGFKPDKVFEQMDRFTSYTERYSYLRDSKYGWRISGVVIEEEDWQNGVFNYGDEKIKSTILLLHRSGLVSDIDINAPAGYYFGLMTYGSKIAGEIEVRLRLHLTRFFIDKYEEKVIYYTAKRRIVDTGIDYHLEYDRLYIGETNPATVVSKGIPGDDLKEGVVFNRFSVGVLGDKDHALVIGTQGQSITISDKYAGNDGKDIFVAYINSYVQSNSGTGECSETDNRAYRGEQLISNADITKKLEEIADTDFDFTPIPSTLIQGVVCTLAYMYDVNAIKGKGGVCEDNGLTAFGTDQQANVMIDTVEGTTFDDGYLYRYGQKNIVPTDAPSYTATFQYGYVTFVPAKEGKQAIEVSIRVKQGSSTTVFSFQVEVNVKSHEGTIDYNNRDSTFFFLNNPVSITTTLSGYTDASMSNTVTKAVMIPRDESYFSVALNDQAIYLTSLKDVEDIDRRLFVGHTVNISTYESDDPRSERTYFDLVNIDNTHVYSLDNLKPSLVDLKGDVVFETMEKNTSYTERYSYLRKGYDGWVVESTKLVEDKTWMAHLFEYDGATTTNGQLLSTGRYRLTYDRDITAPSDRWFSLPCYGGRELGDFEVTLEVVIATTQFGRRMSGTIKYKFMRRVVDTGIGVIMVYDKLKAGETTNVGVTQTNIPSSDLKEGVIVSNALYSKVGSMASYFTYNKSPTSVAITGNYPVGSGKGVMLTFVYPYTSRRAGHNARSDTDNRVYRGSVIIKDSDIVK